MAKRPNHFSFEDYQRRSDAQFLVIKEWLFGPDPDPAYDRLNGWKLDQFAMKFVLTWFESTESSQLKSTPTQSRVIRSNQGIH
jgi:hypothetical protein